MKRNGVVGSAGVPGARCAAVKLSMAGQQWQERGGKSAIIGDARTFHRSR
jgi:hypothetical protein